MNIVALSGNVVQKPELKMTNNKKGSTTFQIAVKREPQKRPSDVDFINIVAWDTTAALCAKYLEKGRKVLIIGSMQSRKFKSSSGEYKYTSEIRAKKVEFFDLPPKKEEETEGEE